MNKNTLKKVEVYSVNPPSKISSVWGLNISTAHLKGGKKIGLPSFLTRLSHPFFPENVAVKNCEKGGKLGAEIR